MNGRMFFIQLMSVKPLRLQGCEFSQNALIHSCSAFGADGVPHKAPQPAVLDPPCDVKLRNTQAANRHDLV